MFIVEVSTRDGVFCESFPTYEEAVRRVASLPAESLTGLPLIFQELTDGSQRLVREDGKPLQWHRLPEDRKDGPPEPLPLADEPLGGPIVKERPPVPDLDLSDEPPLPLGGPDEEGDGDGA